MSTVITDAFRVQTRTELGKGASHIVRSNNMVPGIVYGDSKENVTLQVDIRDIQKGLNQTNFYTTIYEFNVNDVTEKVLVKAVQYHPVTDRPIHIDFMRISKGAKIHVNVPVTFINQDQAPGIKTGGLLNIILHSVEVNCSVDNIPSHIEIDLKGRDIGDSITTKETNLGEGVTVLYPERDITFASIVAPMSASDAEGTDAASQ